MIIIIFRKFVGLAVVSLVVGSLYLIPISQASECVDLDAVVSPGPESRITINIRNTSQSAVQVDRMSLPWLSSSAVFHITAVERNSFLPLDSIAAFVDSFDRTPIVIEPDGSLVGEVELDLYAYNASKHISRHGLVVLWAYCVSQLGCDCDVKGGLLLFEKSN